MENFIKIGKDLGLEGDKLLQFAEKEEAEAIEREERNKERELRKLEIEDENKRLEADAENKRMTYLTYSLFASWSLDRAASAISTICLVSDFH